VMHLKVDDLDVAEVEDKVKEAIERADIDS
jgi:hypothetical protein